MGASYTSSGSIQFEVDGVTWTVSSLDSPTHIGQRLRDYVEAGGVIEPYAAPPPPVPTTVTPRQARIALLQAGLLDAVEAAIAASDRQTQLTWEYAVEFRRDDALINGIGTQLNLTSEQIDALFWSASQF